MKHISRKEIENVAKAVKAILGDNFDKEEEHYPAAVVTLNLERKIGASLVNNVLNGAIGYVGKDLATRGGCTFNVEDVRFVVNFKN